MQVILPFRFFSMVTSLSWASPPQRSYSLVYTSINASNKSPGCNAGTRFFEWLCLSPLFSERVPSESQRRLFTEMGMPAAGEPSSRLLLVSALQSKRSTGFRASIVGRPACVCLSPPEHDVPRWLWEIKDAGNGLVRQGHAGEAQGHGAVLCHEDTGEAEGEWVLFCGPSLSPWELGVNYPITITSLT